MRLLLDNVCYRYPSAPTWTVQDITVSVAPGEVVLLTGPTGCGKSTLLRLIAGLLQRHGQGDFSGMVSVDGVDPASVSPAARVVLSGFVSQEPGDQLVSGTAGDELAFAMESACQPSASIEAAIPELLQTVGLTIEPGRSCAALSGGQTQRLVTGAALSAGAGLLLLDEPLAQLDPGGAAALLDRLAVLARSGMAIVMVEHRLEAALRVATRLVIMDDGRLLTDTPASALAAGTPLLAQVRQLGLTVPGMLDLADRIAPHLPEQTRFHAAAPPVALPGASVLSARGLRYRYGDAECDALAGVDLSLRTGERVALLGGNGAGKSTLLGLLSGRLESDVVLPGAVTVPQDPDLALFCPTVAAELAYGPREAGLSGEALEARVAEAAAALSVTALLDRAPQSLSRGQRLRCAVAAALSCRPEVLLLDEPTSGQDHDQIERMMCALREGLADGVLLFATHDIDLALRHATRVLILHEGSTIADASPAVALADLPAEVPITLPPLAAFCRSRGLPPVTAEALAATAAPAPEHIPQPPPVATRPDTPPLPAASPQRSSGLDPRTRLGLISAAGILAISLERPESLLLFALLCAIPLLFVGMDRRWLRRGAIAVAALIWGTVFSQGIFYAEQPRVSLGHLGPLHLYREGVTYGLAQSMRFVGLSLGGIALAVSTPPDRMFAALVRLRIPFGLALMAATALRFLPEIGRETLTVRQARAARGRATWRRGPAAWLALEVGLLRPIVARSWRRAQNLAESLDARGFDPLARRTWRRPLQMRAVDWSLLSAAAAVSASVASARILYALYTAEAIYIPALRPLYGFVRTWL